MNAISMKAFLHHFCNNIREDKKYCFILGAGASRSSGIPTGGELVRQWYSELHEMYEPNELDEWKTKEGISEKDLAKDYSKIFEKRYEIDPKEGFSFLEKIMENIDPSCGYSVLAQLLDTEPHKIVITTNFDSLIEDALFIYTRKRPLVVGHAALGQYIKLFSNRPIIIKIHHDLLFTPKNTVKDTNTLDQNYKNGLQTIFQYYTPLVIGYGGNDGSLMGFLEDIDTIEGGMFWFCRKGDGELNQRIQGVVEKFNGHAVEISGFDEVMLQIGNELNYERQDKKIVEIAEQRAKNYKDQFAKIIEEEATSKEGKDAVSNIFSKGEKDWLYYEVEADKEEDDDKRELIYLEGLKALPDSPELHGNYAMFLENIRKNYDEAEKYYRKALDLNPENAVNVANYAFFLNYIRKDYDNAETYYKKHFKINPCDANNASNYAGFLSDIRKDYDNAETYYKKALDLNLVNANNTGNYAKYLIAKEELDKARSIIQKSFDLSNEGQEDSLRLELWFYRYAVFFSEYPEAVENITTLLDRGIKSLGWHLDDVLAMAKKMNHPNYNGLCALEKRITS
jgi:tetratricopeptide (TPR) repeat protein